MMCRMLSSSRSLRCILVHFMLLLHTKLGTLLAAAPLSPEPPASVYPWPAFALPQTTAAATELQTSGLIIEVVIPKTGSSAMKFALTPVWRALSAMNASTTVVPSDQEVYSSGVRGGAGLPFLAGNCGAPHNDGVERCVGNRFFPCLTSAAAEASTTAAAAAAAGGTSASAKLAPRCRFHPPEQHLTATEVMWGYMGERGLSFWPRVFKQQQPLVPPSSLQGLAITQPRAVLFTMLRSPASRVVSEFHHWQRNWCCGWFFSANLASQRNNLTLSEFLNHPDCPANNRQAWMLADLPLLQLPNTSSFAFGLKVALSPSQFPLYFKAFYGGAADYVDRLNRDDAILRSAESFVSRADVIGLTEQMPLTLAMFLFAIPAARQHLFVWRADNNDNDSSSSSRSSTSGCWQLRKQIEAGLVPTPKEAHTRAVAYPSLPTLLELELARSKNRLDLSLYAHAANAHSRLRAASQLCSDQPVHGE